MKKTTFISIIFIITTFIVYFYIQQEKINRTIENIPEINKELFNKDSEKTIQDMFEDKPIADGNIVITVDKNTVDCGVMVSSLCLIVNGELFYGTIEGFEYEPGYVYRLEVKQIFREGDALINMSSWYYELVREISKEIDTVDRNADISGTEWVWESYEQDGIREIPQKPDRFTLHFNTDGTVSGTTDCNNYSGTYTVIDNSLTIGQLASTLMACMESQEALYQNLLSDIDSFIISENILMLYQQDDVAMTFVPKEKTTS